PVGPDSNNGRWAANGYDVAFVSRSYHAGNSGLLLVKVPADAVTPGQPLELRVALGNGNPSAWFMIKRYPDTIKHENLSPRDAMGLLYPGWEAAPRARVPSARVPSAAVPPVSASANGGG